MNPDTPRIIEYGVRFAKSVMQRFPPGSLKWTYETGLVLQSIWRLGKYTEDSTYGNFVHAHAESLVQEDGTILGYSLEDYNLDLVNAGKILLEIYEVHGNAKFAKATDHIREQLAKQPRTISGGYWHKKIYPYQMWLDGLYMQAPFAVRWGLFHGDSDLIDDACDQLLMVEERTRDETTGLLHHAWDESRAQLWADPKTGKSPHAWGRAMGWYAMALVDVLELLPIHHSKRLELLTLCSRFCGVVLKYRDSESLLWYQVLDHGHRPGNYLESSASSMFCYALAKAQRLGILSETELATAAYQSFLALTDKYVTLEPQVSLGGICKVAGLGGEPYRDGSFAYYVGEPVVHDDFKGVGPYILAAVELSSLGY